MLMKVTKIWLSPDSEKKSRYGLRTLGGIVGIAVLALLLVCGGTVLMLSRGWSRELFPLILCLGVTALAVFLAVRLGRRSVQDATVFFLTEEDALFAVDVRQLVRPGHNLPGYAAAAAETQKLLRRIGAQPYLPAGADEVRKVERIKENGSHYVLSCQVRRPDGRMGKKTYFLIKGCRDEELLLRQLERRKIWAGALELAENRNPRFILLSALACAGFSALCVLSHPALARLPQEIYFPCLGAAFLSLGCLVYFVIRQRRGE